MPAPTLPAYTYQGAGVQAPIEHWNYSPTTTGSMQVYPPGVVSPYHTPDISTSNAIAPGVANSIYQYGQQPSYYPYYSQPSSQSYGQPYGGSGPGQFYVDRQTPTDSTTNAPGEVGTGYSGMLLPSQINAKNYGNSYQYQKDLGWAAYEDAGWDKSLAQEAFERSLPKTGGPKRGSYAF
jgi:hypothetical protein